MAWPKGRPRRAEQGSAAQPDEAQPEQQQQPQAAPPAGLDDWLAYCEAAHIADGVVLVRVEHPQIKQQTHRDGTFSGFAMHPGDKPAAWWSNGAHLRLTTEGQ